MKRIFKILGKLLLTGAIIFVLLIGASKVFEDKIVVKAIQTLNSQLNVPVSVDKVSLNLWRQFPYAAIELHNVLVYSAPGINLNDFKGDYAKKLIELEKVYLAFNIKALINGKYQLSKIVLSKGQINILVDKYGVNNFSVLKNQNRKNSSSDNLEIFLSLLHFKNVSIRNVNAYKNTDVQIKAPNFSAKGKFYQKNYALSTKGKIFLQHFKSNKLSFVPQSATSLNLDLGINNDTIRINNGGFNTAGIHFNVLGSVIISSPLRLNLNVKGSNISIESILNLLPNKFAFANDLSGQGIIEMEASVRGKLTEKISPNIKSKFSFSQASISHKKTQVSIQNLNLSGEFSNYSSPMLSLSDFSFSSKSSTFKGSLSLNNFKNPRLKLKADFSINANEMAGLVNSKAIDSISGNISGNISSNGLLPEKFSAAILSSFNNTGNFKVDNFNLLLNDSPVTLKNISGTLWLQNDKISIQKADGYLMNIKASCSGTVTNLLHSLSYSYQQVEIAGTLLADTINYSVLAPLLKSNSKSSEQKTAYNINTRVLASQFIYNSFVANNLSTQFAYLNGQTHFTNLNFYALNGSVKANVKYHPTHNNANLLSIDASTNKVNIQKLFRAFNSFDQTFITDKNLQGKLTSDFEAEIIYANKKFLSPTLDFMGHLKLEDGRLTDFEPAMELSRFSDIDELRNMQFETIENDILISNGIINIPKMDILSNVFTISLFGQQYFNGSYEYHLKLLLSDIFGNKRNTLQKRQSQFGTIQDDGSGNKYIYLVATSKKGKTDIKYDKKELGNHLKSEIKQEKQELKEILNKEFGWFKNDSIKKNQKEQTQPQFEIEWDEE